MPEQNGNTSQNRVIMDHVADTAITRFVERYPEMKPKPDSRVGVWISALALAVSVLTGAVVFGKVVGQVDRNTQDIRDDRSDRREMNDKLTDIQLDVRDIKSKFEILVPTPEYRSDGQ